MEPSNHGKTWTDEMDQQLLECIREDMSLQQMADVCGRTPGGIVGRMEHLGTTYIRFVQLKRIIKENL